MAYQTIPSRTAATTLAVAGASIDVPILAGDGKYAVDFTAAATTAIVVVALRVNGAALTTPRNMNTAALDTSTPAQNPDTDTVGNVFWNRGAYTVSRVNFNGEIIVRNGEVCMFDIRGFGTDATFVRKQFTHATGKFNPATTVGSIGFSTDGSFTAGAVLRATKISE